MRWGERRRATTASVMALTSVSMTGCVVCIENASVKHPEAQALFRTRRPAPLLLRSQLAYDGVQCSQVGALAGGGTRAHVSIRTGGEA